MVMQENRIPFRELPPSEQGRLCEVYGPQPQTGYAARRISYVRELNDYEAWFFGHGNFLSPSFMTQTLYKLKGTLSPIRFSRALRELNVQEDVLRTNYCDVGDRVLAVVVKERDDTEAVIYQRLQGRHSDEINDILQKSEAAALRYPFDVKRGGLLRICVFHTGQDEYAVLVTAAQIIMDRFDIRSVFRSALGLPEKESRVPSFAPQNVQMEAKIRDYWKKLLAGVPRRAPLPWELPETPPHLYKQRACRIVFPAALFSELMGEAKGNRLMMMAFLATAWGLLLQIEGRRRDLCFCLITPSRSVEEGDAWRLFQMVPVRQTLDKEEKTGDLVRRQFQQILVSNPYASLDWDGFGHFLGGGEKPFDHFLDFYDFLSEEKPYSAQPAEPEGHIVSRHSWDAQSMKLSLYFRYTASKASFVLLYDEGSFAPGTSERIAKIYLLTIQQMLTDRYETFAVFQENLMKRLYGEKKLYEAYQKEEQARLQNAVSAVRLLQGMDAGTTQFFMQEGTLQTYFEGDYVEGMNRDLLFVAEGKLARSIEDESGWYRTLNIAKEGAWLNENVLLGERRVSIAAEVLSERATILSIPKAALENALSLYPSLWQNIVSHAITQLETFQRLWAQS